MSYDDMSLFQKMCGGIVKHIDLEGRQALRKVQQTIDALARGRVTRWHCEQVTPEMLRAYLERHSVWRPTALCDGHFLHHKNPRGTTKTRYCCVEWDAAKAIGSISEAENRGELEIWMDIMRGGE